MRKLMAGMLLAALAGGANATTGTFSIDTHGSGYTTYNFYDPRCNPTVFGCSPAGQSFSWTGSVSVDLTNNIDGTYVGSDVLSLQASIVDSTTHVFSESFTTDGSNNSLYGIAPISVTVSNGQIVSITEGYWNQYDYVGFTGSLITFEDGIDFSGTTAQHASVTTGNGFLGPIPEPSTYVLMIAGIAAIAVRLKKRASA